MYKCKRCNEFIKADDKVKTKGVFRSYCKCGWVEYTAPYDLWEEIPSSPPLVFYGTTTIDGHKS